MDGCSCRSAERLTGIYYILVWKNISFLVKGHNWKWGYTQWSQMEVCGLFDSIHLFTLLPDSIKRMVPVYYLGLITRVLSNESYCNFTSHLPFSHPDLAVYEPWEEKGLINSIAPQGRIAVDWYSPPRAPPESRWPLHVSRRLLWTVASNPIPGLSAHTPFCRLSTNFVRVGLFKLFKGEVWGTIRGVTMKRDLSFAESEPIESPAPREPREYGTIR